MAKILFFIFLVSAGVICSVSVTRRPRTIGKFFGFSDKSPATIPPLPLPPLFQKPLVYSVTFQPKRGQTQVQTQDVPKERVYLNIYGQNGKTYYDRQSGQILVPCPYYNHQVGRAGVVDEKPVLYKVRHGQGQKQVGVSSPYGAYSSAADYYNPFVYFDPYYYFNKGIYPHSAVVQNMQQQQQQQQQQQFTPVINEPNEKTKN